MVFWLFPFYMSQMYTKSRKWYTTLAKRSIEISKSDHARGSLIDQAWGLHTWVAKRLSGRPLVGAPRSAPLSTCLFQALLHLLAIRIAGACRFLLWNWDEKPLEKTSRATICRDTYHLVIVEMWLEILVRWTRFLTSLLLSRFREKRISFSQRGWIIYNALLARRRLLCCCQRTKTQNGHPLRAFGSLKLVSSLVSRYTIHLRKLIRKYSTVVKRVSLWVWRNNYSVNIRIDQFWFQLSQQCFVAYDELLDHKYCFPAFIWSLLWCVWSTTMFRLFYDSLHHWMLWLCHCS